MKRVSILFIIILIASSICVAQEKYNNFIKKNNAWVMMNIHSDGDSVCRSLGYTEEMYFSPLGKENKVLSVYRKALSGDIIIVTTKSNVKFITDKDVEDYSDGFDIKFYYNWATKVEERLDSGIIKKTLPLYFLADVMNFKVYDANVKDTVAISDTWRYRLTFHDGYLTKYEPTDGLDRYARYYQDYVYFKKMEEYAKAYWKSNKSKVLWELNTQCRAWYHIPGDIKNKYCYLFSTCNGEICNAKIMNVALYGDVDIAEQELKDITHGEAKFDGTKTYYNKICRRYCYMGYYFLFDSLGNFYKVIEIE